MSSMFEGATSFDKDIGSWDVTALLDATNMFAFVSLSNTNYDSLLVGWNAQSLQPEVNFNGGNSKYCSAAAVAARANMIASDSWVITDGGVKDVCGVDVVTKAASDVSHSSATLNGTVNPKGIDTTARFYWGTDSVSAWTSPAFYAGSGTSAVAYSFSLSNLECNKTHFFSTQGQNASGTVSGNSLSFTTAACPPPPPIMYETFVEIISPNVVFFSGFVNPNGSSTRAWFEWGTSTQYGQSTASFVVGSDDSPVNNIREIKGLSCGGVTYHFRIVAENSGGIAYSLDNSFTTTSCPVMPPDAVTIPADSPGPDIAIFNGLVNPNGSSTSAWFEWGTTTEYGQTTSSTNVGSESSPVPYNHQISSLSCGTTYHFRVVANNAGGTANGSDCLFTTSVCEAGNMIFDNSFEASCL